MLLSEKDKYNYVPHHWIWCNAIDSAILLSIFNY